MAETRAELPTRGTNWPSLRERLVALGANDVDWRHARAAVYVFHAGDDVLAVAKDAYAMYQSENALGPGAFPSLKRMEEDVVGMGLSLLHAPEGARASSRHVFTASMMLSVPPEVRLPRAPSGACNNPRPIPTTSSSMRFKLGNAPGPSAFSDW